MTTDTTAIPASAKHDSTPKGLVGIPENIGRARIEGSEASLRVRLGRGIALGARAARLPVAKNLATGERLGKRPRWRSGADAEWDASRALRLHAGGVGAE